MHAFLALRDKLPELTFDPAVDVHSDALGHECADMLNQYLQTYSLTNIVADKQLCRQHVIGTTHVDGYQIVCQYWLSAQTGNNRGTLWFLHGYYDHTGLFDDLVHYFLTEGFNVIAYDQPGHGLSSGEPASIDTFQTYVNVLNHCLELSKLPQPLHFVGLSTGCAVMMMKLLQLRESNPFANIVLLAPLIRPAHWNLAVWLYRILVPFVKKIPRRVSENSNDPNFVQFIHFEDPLQCHSLKTAWVSAMKPWTDSFETLEARQTPCLVIQGKCDETVDWQYNMQQLQQKLPQATIHLLPEARHHLPNERRDIQQDVFTLTKQFLLASTS